MQNTENIRIPKEERPDGMVSRMFMRFGFGQSNSANNANGPADMTVTGEGCESLSDMGWKKKENKFLGNNSLSEREFKERRELDNKPKVD